MTALRVTYAPPRCQRKVQDLTLAPRLDTDAALLQTLRGRDLAGWRTLTDALPTRFSQALAAAIKEAEPKARRVVLPGATIHDETELEAWLDQARAKIEQALQDGPVIL